MASKRGCFEFRTERNADLLAAYRRQFSPSEAPADDILAATVAQPSKRFWVSERRATVVVSRMLRGESLHGMRPNTRLMYNEICRRVIAAQAQAGFAAAPLTEIVSTIIEQPAPCFYLTPQSARVILSRIRQAARIPTQK